MKKNTNNCYLFSVQIFWLNVLRILFNAQRNTVSMIWLTCNCINVYMRAITRTISDSTSLFQSWFASDQGSYWLKKIPALQQSFVSFPHDHTRNGLNNLRCVSCDNERRRRVTLSQLSKVVCTNQVSKL